MRTFYFTAVVSSFFFFFLARLQRLQIGCLPCFYTWRGLSANLKCMSEICCTWLVENTGRKNSPSAHHQTTISSQVRHMSTVGKNLLNSNISSTCPQNMVNFGPLAVEIGWYVRDFPLFPLKIALFTCRYLDSELHVIHGSLAHPSPHPKWHQSQFSHCCRAHDHDIPTDHTTPSVTRATST